MPGSDSQFPPAFVRGDARFGVHEGHQLVPLAVTNDTRGFYCQTCWLDKETPSMQAFVGLRMKGDKLVHKVLSPCLTCEDHTVHWEHLEPTQCGDCQEAAKDAS